MTIEEFEKEYRKILDELGSGLKVTDEELVKMFLSHIVVSKYQIDDLKKATKKIDISIL